MLSQQCIQTVQAEFVLVIFSANPSPSLQLFFKEIHLLHFFSFSNKQMTYIFLIQTLLTILIVLLDETDIAAAEHYGNLQNSISQVGLRINKDKTEIMHREGASPKALVGLKVVEDFEYLAPE